MLVTAYRGFDPEVVVQVDQPQPWDQGVTAAYSALTREGVGSNPTGPTGRFGDRNGLPVPKTGDGIKVLPAAYEALNFEERVRFPLVPLGWLAIW